MVEFVSYSGKYPCLCMGDLVLKIGKKKYTGFRLSSGGSVTADSDWNFTVEEGSWEVSNWPEDFPKKYREEAISVINSHVDYGCCGGCI